MKILRAERPIHREVVEAWLSDSTVSWKQPREAVRAKLYRGAVFGAETWANPSQEVLLLYGGKCIEWMVAVRAVRS